jgi:hypothetical protein
LSRIGARVHLAERADTVARPGEHEAAKNDRADVRHLRELLMAGRISESWVAPGICLTFACRSGCVTGALSSAVGGSSGSSPPSITTAARNAVTG